MQKFIIGLGSLITAAALYLMGSVLYFWLNPLPDADMTDSYEYLVRRPDNWRRLVDEALLTKEEMTIIDGSTATIPITAELYRQFFPDDPLIVQGMFPVSLS